MDQNTKVVTVELERVMISGRELRFQFGSAKRSLSMLDSLTGNKGFSIDYETTPDNKLAISIFSYNELIAVGRPVLVSTNGGELVKVGILITNACEAHETLTAPLISNVICLENQFIESIPDKQIKLVKCRIFIDGSFYGIGMVNNATKIFGGASKLNNSKIVISNIERNQYLID